MVQTEALAELKAALAGGGVRAALGVLNSRTEHRFTSLHGFDGNMLRNLTFYDRANPDAEPPDDIPVEASYCVYVRDTDRPFRVEDSLNDVRVGSHPKQQEIQAYCGVPLVDSDGRTFGTLCHFDFRPLPISEENVWLMEAFGALLKQHELSTRARESGSR